MTADPTSDRAAQEQLVADVEGLGELESAQTDRVLRECLSLMDKRLAAAIRPALEDLQSATPRDQSTARSVPETRALELDMALAVRKKGELFVQRFSAEFRQAFQRHRAGKPRTRGQRDESVALAHRSAGGCSLAIAMAVPHLCTRQKAWPKPFAPAGPRWRSKPRHCSNAR